ncbi:hypothetical protein HME9302_01523 [Alteripontixanthobacter maritimus]|uniref:Uncharacterized protein n=1 Tax=Alteripontixanthobacter maritimus TaxID=2161824 RepID=A0A369Q616_9SPHN|nr:hypothetical protein [Alteripontixanthobacter maritimus]RDC60321.1 hypothetical protein HME9302_01523 [Alteripontixanthobacter maritimus]
MTLNYAEPARNFSWRVWLWIGAATLLLLPAIAMQFTAEVAWGSEDFLVMGAMLMGLCAALDLASRLDSGRLFKVGIGVLALAVFLLVWAQLAVGLV